MAIFHGRSGVRSPGPLDRSSGDGNEMQAHAPSPWSVRGRAARYFHHAKRFVPGEIWSGQGATRPALDATPKLGTRCHPSPPAHRRAHLRPPRGASIKPKILGFPVPSYLSPLLNLSRPPYLVAYRSFTPRLHQKFHVLIKFRWCPGGTHRKMGKTWALITHLHALAG